MIFKRNADNIEKAAYEVTVELLNVSTPEQPVLIKPNIVNPSRPPVTTDMRVVKGVLHALRESGIHNIIVAEGSGTGDTRYNFEKLGYSGLGVRLVDLDKEGAITAPVTNHRVWKQIYIPEIVMNKFIISVPVLKEHSMCGVSISLKNMVGVLPEKYYSGYWTYKKSQIHKYNTDGCIADIIRVIRPDWAIVDASIGMKGSHLSGTPVTPPLNLVYSSDDPLEADKYGCELLGIDWKDINYLRIINPNAFDK